MIQKHMILFGSSDDSEYSINAARSYIGDNGYTAEQVKLVNRDGQILVVAKMEIE